MFSLRWKSTLRFEILESRLHFGFSTVNHSCVQRCLRRRLKRYRLSADLCRFAPSSHLHWQDDCVPNPQCPSCMTACIPHHHHHRFLSDNGGSTSCQSRRGDQTGTASSEGTRKRKRSRLLRNRLETTEEKEKQSFTLLIPFTCSDYSVSLCVCVCART